MFRRVVWLVLRKDLTVEIRSLEIAYTTLFFAVSCVLVFAFALVQEGRAPEDGAAGILWIAIAFAGTLALGRTFERERQAETLRALLLAPAARPAIYVGKLLGILTLLIAAEIVLVPLVALLFQAPLLAHPVWLAAILLAGTLGFASVGTRCSRRCSSVRAAATYCCRCCCIRSPFRSSLPGSGGRRRCCSRMRKWRWSASGWRCSSRSTSCS
jgi:heme exporter protein CcmB